MLLSLIPFGNLLSRLFMSNNFVSSKDCQTINQKIMEKIDDLSKKVEAIGICIAELPEKIFEKADKRYAGKSFEQVAWLIIGAIITGVITMVIRYIERK